MTAGLQSWIAFGASVVLCAVALFPLIRRRWSMSSTSIAVSSAAIVVAALVGVATGLVFGVRPTTLVVVAISALAVALTALAASLHLAPPSLTLVMLLVASLAIVLAGAVFPATGFLWFDAPFTVAAVFAFTLACREVESSPGILPPVAVVMLVGITLIGLGRGDHQLHTLTAAAAGTSLAVIWWTRNGGPAMLGPGAALFLGFVLLAGIAGLRGPFWVAAFPIASGLLVIPLADTATVWDSRRRLGQAFRIDRPDHISHRLIARGFNPAVAAALLTLAAVVGAAASTLTAFGYIPWYVGLTIAWATKIGIVAWAMRNPVPELN